MIVQIKYILQLAGTLAVLAVVPGNALKAVLLVFFWIAVFFPISAREIILYMAACLMFDVLDVMAVRQGIFYFNQPDALGLPVWEYLMYGFYVLNGLRLINGPIPLGKKKTAFGMAAAMALCFACIPSQFFLTIMTYILLGVSFILFHEPYDLIYTGYFVLMGALVEYTGIWTGLWGYPGHYAIGLPLWFITMWGSIGLFTRRLILPVIHQGNK